MHILIKFTPKLEFAKSFQQGKLYMNTLNYYWTNGFEDQRDILEGVVSLTAPNNLDFLPEEFRKVQYTDMQLQAVGYQYCNVFCMHKIDLIPQEETPTGTVVAYQTSSKMAEFGEYAIVIDDEAEYLRRINRAAGAQGHKYLCGRVNYHRAMIAGKPIDTHAHHIILKTDETFDMDLFGTRGRHRDSFDKYDKYLSQNEWRVTLYRGVKETEAYTFYVGDLSDITHIVKASNLEANLHQIIQNPKYYNSCESYYGNTSRRELFNLFSELGDNKAWLIGSVG